MSNFFSLSGIDKYKKNLTIIVKQGKHSNIFMISSG